MAPIKVGIVGYRYSAKVFHLPYLLPNPEFEIYAVLQRTAAPGEGEEPPPFGHCTIDFPEAKHYKAAEDFFGDANIDLVIICTRIHEELIEQGLKAGKHVVVEKPFVPTSSAADRLIQLAKEKNKILTVFQSKSRLSTETQDGRKLTCSHGKYPTIRVWYRGYYERVADAILGRKEVYVKPETARDGLKIIELARESHFKGVTMPFSST